VALSPTSPALAFACLIGLFLSLGRASLSDLHHRRIPNRVCLAIALLAIPYWLVIEPFPARIAIQLGIALILGLGLLVLFLLDLIGGGDVKMLAALALWLRPEDLGRCLVIIAIAGGILGVCVAIGARRRLGKPTVPYGVAIAIGGLATMAPRAWLLV